MSSPWDDGRDSNNGGFDFGDTPSTVADSHLGAFRDSFGPPGDRLSEEDYRGPETGGGASTDQVSVDRVPREMPQQFYPHTPPRAGGGLSPDGSRT